MTESQKKVASALPQAEVDARAYAEAQAEARANTDLTDEEKAKRAKLKPKRKQGDVYRTRIGKIYRDGETPEGDKE